MFSLQRVLPERGHVSRDGGDTCLEEDLLVLEMPVHGLFRNARLLGNARGRCCGIALGVEQPHRTRSGLPGVSFRTPPASLWSFQRYCSCEIRLFFRSPRRSLRDGCFRFLQYLLQASGLLTIQRGPCQEENGVHIVESVLDIFGRNMGLTECCGFHTIVLLNRYFGPASLTFPPASYDRTERPTLWWHGLSGIWTALRGEPEGSGAQVGGLEW